MKSSTSPVLKAAVSCTAVTVHCWLTHLLT